MTNPIQNIFNELNKMETLIAAGKLSDRSIKLAKKKGFIRRYGRWQKGVKRGTDEIRRKAGATFKTRKDINKDIKDVQDGLIKAGVPKDVTKNITKDLVKGPEKAKGLGSYKTNVDPSVGTIVTTGKQKKVKGHVIHNRHEADEANHARKNINGIYDRLITTHNKKYGSNLHFSPEVLAKERKLTDFAKNAYKGSNVAKSSDHVQRHRSSTKVNDYGGNESQLAKDDITRRKMRRKDYKKYGEQQKKSTADEIKQRRETMLKNRAERKSKNAAERLSQQKKEIEQARLNRLNKKRRG